MAGWMPSYFCTIQKLYAKKSRFQIFLVCEWLVFRLWVIILLLDLCPVVKWSGIGMVVWKPDWKKPEYGAKCLVFEWAAKACNFTIWILDNLVFRWIRNSGVRYSDGYCFSYLQWPFGCFLFPFLSSFCTGFSFSGVYRLARPLLSLSSLSPLSQPAKQKTSSVQWSHIHSIWDDLLKNSLSTFNTFRVLTKCVLTQA